MNRLTVNATLNQHLLPYVRQFLTTAEKVAKIASFVAIPVLTAAAYFLSSKFLSSWQWGPAIVCSLTILFQPYNKTFIEKCLTRKVEQMEDKLSQADQETTLSGSLLKQVYQVMPESRDLLSQMNFAQLEEVSHFVRPSRFATSLQSGSSGPVSLWQTLCELTHPKRSLENICSDLVRLKNQQSEEWYIPFMYALNRAMQKSGRYEALKAHLMDAAPFLTPEKLVDIPTSRGALRHLIHRFPHGDMHSFKRVLANLEGSYPAATLEEWLSDIKTAKTSFDDKAVQAVEEAYARLCLPLSLKSAVKIADAYSELNFTTPFSEKMQAYVDTNKARVRQNLQREPTLKNIQNCHECMDPPGFIDTFEAAWRNLDKMAIFKELYAYAVRFNDPKARYMLARLTTFYGNLTDDLKLQLYAYHEVPEGLL